MKSIPTYFGEIAISEEYITPEVFEECLKKYQLRPGQSKMIGEFMKKQGILTEEQVNRILAMQQVYWTKLQNEYFVHLALQNEVLTYQQFRELERTCAREAANGKYLNIADLAVQQEYVSEAKAKEIINSLDYQYFVQLKKQGKSSLGGYELVGNIVKLKRATLYKGIQVALDRAVAVKVLLSEFENEENIRKFFHEAEISALFNHPNLPRVYDKSVDCDTYYYSMEWIAGQNLVQRLADEVRLQNSEALRLIRQIARALEHIHSYDRIHSKVNPRNILIRYDGIGKLIDLSACYNFKRGNASNKKVSKMPQYMAPEQFSPNDPVDVRTDIYGLGATFYRIITGVSPIAGKTLDEIRRNVREQEPRPIGEIDPTIPDDLAKIIHRMMRKDPSKRYREIKNVLFALKKILI